MFDVQKMFKAVSDMARHDRGHYHLTLGALIDALEQAPAHLPVEFDRGEAPGDTSSYRGYYDDLALEPLGREVRVSELLTECLAALGATFHGYKGGEFVMGPETPLWAAPWGSCGPAIVGITVTDEKVILATKEVD